MGPALIVLSMMLAAVAPATSPSAPATSPSHDEDLAKARETFQRRSKEYDQASDALRVRLNANPEWVKARDLFRRTGDALLAAKKTGTPLDVSEANAKHLDAARVFTDVNQRLVDADEEYVQARRNVGIAGVELREAEQRATVATTQRASATTRSTTRATPPDAKSDSK